MSIVLELRDHTLHAGKPLVHPSSEDVLLSNVFGIVKNLPHDRVLAPWIAATTGLHSNSTEWQVEFWQKQSKPQRVIEGSTAVDLVLETDDVLVFVEVKLDAPASSGTTHNPGRDQLTRNLDVGYAAAKPDREFALIFVTPDRSEPGIIQRLRARPGPFPLNASTPPNMIVQRLYWAPWSSIGHAVASAYTKTQLSTCENWFALDLLAYLAKKGLWENTLPDHQNFYSSRLYRPLRHQGSQFEPYATRAKERYQDWRSKAWKPEELIHFLECLRTEDKALLKLLADAG